MWSLQQLNPNLKAPKCSSCGSFSIITPEDGGTAESQLSSLWHCKDIQGLCFLLLLSNLNSNKELWLSNFIDLQEWDASNSWLQSNRGLLLSRNHPLFDKSHWFNSLLLLNEMHFKCSAFWSFKTFFISRIRAVVWGSAVCQLWGFPSDQLRLFISFCSCTMKTNSVRVGSELTKSILYSGPWIIAE